MPETRLAIFAYPWNLDPATPAEIVARDDAGNEAVASFNYRVFPKKFHTDTISLNDAYIQRVVPPIMSQTPEIDDQLTAAKAKLNAASAAVKVRDAEGQFAMTTYARWRDSPRGVVSVQEQEAKQADYESGVARLNAAKADMAVAQADVARLESLESFKQVVAPFDGIVTARKTDIGALIQAGSASNAPVGIFRSMLSTAANWPNCFEMPRSQSSAM